MRAVRRAVVAGCLVASITAVGLAAAAAQPISHSITGATANQILAASLRAARVQHSVHAVEIEHIGHLVVIQRDDSNERSGLQQLVFSSGATVDIRLFRAVLYIKANAKGIQLVYSKRDDKYADVWVSVPKSSGAFAKLAEGIDFPALLA